MSSKAKTRPPGSSKENQLPDFNSDALQSLTKKIHENFKKPNDPPPKNPQVKPKKTATSRSNGGDIESDVNAITPRPKPKEPSKGKQAPMKQKPAVAQKEAQGKKRLRDGNVKEQSRPTNGNSQTNSIPLGSKTSKSAPIRSVGLEEDIRALGGTDDDFKLVADVCSDSEVDGDESDNGKTSGGHFKSELLQMVHKLGIDKVDHEEEEETSESEENDDSQEQKQKILQSGASSQSKMGLTSVKSNVQASKSTGRGQSQLIFQPQSEWHAVELPPLPSPSGEQNVVPRDFSDHLLEYSKSLLEKENSIYAATHGALSSAHQFYSTIMSTGTLSDKISALTLSVQESPVHNMKALENLVGLARKRSRGQAVEVLGALKDLFGPGNLLPSDRRLKTFASQPALAAVFDDLDFEWTSKNPLPKPLKEIHLISWAYEDWLKSLFFEVLKIIESWCNDEVVFARGKAVDYVCQLLKEKPEQEANLLRLLVNKLGDSDKKIASKTSFNILQLETTHPLMKPTITAAIESDLLFRPGQSWHAKYYATITLNQTVLSSKEEGVARKLLDIYFSLFVKLLEKPDESKDAPAAAGVTKITINRKGEVQGGGGPAGKKALRKLKESEKATTVDEDLREKMLSAVLTGVNRAIPFTNTNDESFQKHLETLFRVTHSSNFNTSIQALMLIQQLHGSHQASSDRFYRTLYESLLDPRLLTSSKQALYLNLLFRALRADLQIKRVKAFAKRLLQVVAMHQASFTCGVLYLLRELEIVFPSLQAFIDQPEEDPSDDEETFHDVEEDPSTNGVPVRSEPVPSKSHPRLRYDGRKRAPEYSNASTSTLWELHPLINHYHPSVSLFAQRLLAHAPMPPKPDLSLNTLIHFLDRFVYKNPKANTTTARGASIMQPMAGGDRSAVLVSSHSTTTDRSQPVNSEAFWRQAAEKVGADEVFFHRYFSTLGRGKDKAQKKKKAEKRKGAADSDDDDNEADEDEIWKALAESRPELEGEEESEAGFSDLDDGDDGDLDMDMDDPDDAGSDEHDSNGALLAKDARDEEEENEDNIPDLGDDTDDDALFASDDEVPSDLEKAFEKEEEGKRSGGKRKGDAGAVAGPAEESKRGGKRRRLKQLPLFADADDYATIVEGEGDMEEEEEV